MNIRKTQHRVLKVLYAHYNDWVESGFKINQGLSWDELAKRSNLTSEQLWFVAPRLTDEKDVEGQNFGNTRIYFGNYIPIVRR